MSLLALDASNWCSFWLLICSAI